MPAKYLVFCFLICVIEARSTEPSTDVPAINDVKHELEDIGNMISEGFQQVKTGIVNEFHKVERAIQENPDVLGEVKHDLKDIGKKITEGFKRAEEAVVNEYNKVEHAVEEEFNSLKTVVLNACSCTNYNCGCCAHLEESQIELNATICTNISYLVHDYGISFTVTVNGYAIFNETVSARNPPPVCLGVPYVKELADVCVRLYDINATTSYLHACVRVEARMKTILIAKYDLGCFNLGPPGVTSDVNGGFKTDLETLVNEIEEVFRHAQNTVTTKSTPNIGLMLIANSNNEPPSVDVDTTIDDDQLFVETMVSSSDKTHGLLIPVVASVGAIILIGAITLVVYIAIKKKRDEQRAMLQFMKRYGSTTSLVPHMDPYC